MSSLSEKIKYLREKANVSLRTIEEITGVGHATINNIERGLCKNAKLETLDKLADFFKVPVHSLIDDELSYMYDLPKELQELGIKMLVVTSDKDNSPLTDEETQKIAESIRNYRKMKKANQ